MKGKALGIIAVIVLALGLAGNAPAQTRTLTILHSNDTHSAMLPLGSEEGASGKLRAAALKAGPGTAGIARMASLIRRLRTEGGNVLALNAGDVFVGSFEFNKYLGYPELKIMEGLYDAMALGNHEFDLGLDALAGVLSGQLAGGAPVSLPVLCADINLAGTPLQSVVQPAIIKTVGGIKVGIFGLVNPDPQHYSPDIAGRLPADLTALLTIAGEQAGALKLQGCDVVVCLSHLGTVYDLYGLADNVPSIDVIVGGHSHDVFPAAVLRNGKIIVQAGDYGRFLGELKLNIAAGAVLLESWTLHALDKSVPEDPRVRSTLNSLRDGVVQDPRFGPVYTRKIADAAWTIDQKWPADGPNRDSSLGNLVTDAFKAGLAESGISVDLALDVLGYTATSIPAGKVVGNDILRAVPYGYDPDSGLGFKIVIVPMTGELILGGLEYAAGMVTLTTDLGIQASGLTYTYDSNRPAAGFGQTPTRVDVMSVMINGELVVLNTQKVYLVAMSDQVYNFLNALVAPLIGQSLPCQETGLFEYNVVRDYMKGLKTIDSVSEGRIMDTAGSPIK